MYDDISYILKLGGDKMRRSFEFQGNAYILIVNWRKSFVLIIYQFSKLTFFSCCHEDLATCVHNMLLNKMKDRKTFSHELLVFLPIAFWSMLYIFYSFCVPNLTAAFVCCRTKLPLFHLIGETAASAIVPLLREAKIYFYP